MKVPSVYLGIKKPRIEMLPLIDIVFLLLVFFIYAMLSMAVHRSLPVVLPTSSAAQVDTAVPERAAGNPGREEQSGRQREAAAGRSLQRQGRFLPGALPCP